MKPIFNGVSIRYQVKFTVFRRQAAFSDAFNRTFVVITKFNQIADGAQFYTVFLRKISKSGRRAMVPSSLRISTITEAGV